MNPIFPNHQIIRLEQTTSTNEYMLQVSAKENVPEGSVVIADSQTQGRGQGNNSWESKPNQNLTFSIILYPSTVKGSRQFLISKLISLAVYDFVSQLVPNVCIKWPNDVYVGDKKITGILIENFIEGPYLTKSIAGIGLNVNQENFSNHISNPVSLRQLTGKTYHLEFCFEELHRCIANRYQMVHEQENQLHTDYLQHMYRRGILSRFSVDGKYFDATIVGVNKYGMIEMTTLNGEQKTFGFKEVVFE